ncbi:hypothetical protein KSP40_PGU006559 [Platanthera guangdongensis]|uniref:Uncharacterized protein n=1 Tax=Platanthera guangdongensis TaxID=2320717 RepID=A0ABR2LDT8_9ASPA
MILSAAMSMKKSPVLKVTGKRNGLPVSLASMSKSSIRIDTEHLRNQIDQLKHEAEITRSKANNARVRLMRLSQAAENLQHWAAMDVALNKENEAREFLMQNKKILQALERTKRRLEVLDELSVKINEVIIFMLYAYSENCLYKEAEVA